MGFNYKNIILFILMISGHQFFASQKDSLRASFEDLKSRSLLVCLQTENPKVIEKLSGKKNPKELEVYRQAIKSTNDNFKKSVKAFWTLNTDIRFIPLDSLEWYKANFPKKYGYLTISRTAVHSGGVTNVGAENVLRFSNQGLHVFLCDKSRSIAFSLFPADEVGQEIPKDLKENNVMSSDYYLPSASFIYALYRIGNVYTDITKNIYPPFLSRNAINSGFARNESKEELTKKTLVVRAQDCEKGFDPEKAKKDYPYSLKVISDEEFEGYLFAKDPGITCFYLIFTSANTMGGGGISITRALYMQQAIRANDGAIIAAGVGHGLNNKVLKDFVKSMEKAEKVKAEKENKD